MGRRLFILFTIYYTGILVFGASARADGKVRLPAYETIVFPNGLKIFLMPDRKVPLVYVSVAVADGSQHDGFSKAGLAELTVQGLALGSRSFTKDQMEETLDFTGATLDQGTARDYSQIDLSFRKQDGRTLIPILADMIKNPVFPKAEVLKLRDVTVTHLLQNLQSPASVANMLFDTWVFGPHPYGVPPSGTPQSVRGLSLEDLRQHHGKYYHPHNMVVAVVGDFDSLGMKKILTDHFGNWTGPSKPEKRLRDERGEKPQIFPKPNTTQVLLVHKADAQETTFRIGGLGFARNTADFIAMHVINTALGGRFTSLLNDALRVKTGLTYGAKSAFDCMKQGGVFSIATYTSPDQTVKAIDLALNTYHNFLEQGLEPSVLASAKAYVKGQFPPQYETMGSWAHYLVESWVYDLPARWIEDFDQQVASLTEDRVKFLTQKYYPKENLKILVIGKADQLRSSLKKYGDIIEREISTLQHTHNVF